MKTSTPEMNTSRPGRTSLVYFIPSADDVASLSVGDLALDCFGRWSKVTEISCRRTDISGRAFVLFSTKYGPTSSITGSYKVGELVRTVHLSSRHLSVELTRIEQEMNASSERIRNV